MKSAAISFLFLFFSTYAHAQSDAEKLLLSKFNAEDYKEVLSLADSILSTNPSVNKTRINQIKADAYYFLNDVSSALTCYLRSLESLGKQSLKTTHLIEVYSHTGFCYKYLGNYIEALPYYQQALKITESVNDSLEIANQSYSLGEIYMELGEFKKAQQFLENAYHLDFVRNDKAALGYDLSILGDLMIKLNNYPDALQYYQQAVAIKETLANNVNTETLRFGKLSQAFLLTNQLDSAMYYNELAMSIAKDQGDSLSLAKHWIDKTQIDLYTNDLLTAKRFCEKALSYFERIEASKFQIEAGYLLVDVYDELGNYTNALNHLDNLILFSKENTLLEEAAHGYLKKSQILEKKEKHNQALLNYKLYQQAKDTLGRNQQLKTTLLLEKEYQTTQKEQQIELLQAKDLVSQLELNRKKRDNFILWTLLIILLAVSGFVYYSIRRKNQLKNSLLTSQINELRLQIKAVVEGSTENMKLDSEALNSSIEEPLSEREFEILNFAISDLSNVEIADKTFVSVNTVKYHLKNIYTKLGVSNRKEALRIAFQSISN